MSFFEFSCNFCSSPERMTDVAQLEHIRMEHLDHYKPYKCPKYNQNYAVEPTCKEHIVTTHSHNIDDSITADSASSSNYLNVIGDMMMQCSFYNAIGCKQTATKLINAVKQNTVQPETKTFALPRAPSVGAYNKISNATNKCNKSEMRSHSLSQFRRRQQKRNHGAYKTTRQLQNGQTECEFCDASFNCVSRLKLHEDRKHNRVSRGANRCNKCDKRFHFRSNLRCHNPNPNITPGVNSSTKSQISTRKSSAEPESLKSNDNGPALQKLKSSEAVRCPHCPMTFGKMGNWRVHQDNRHNRVSSGPYQCAVCNKRYYGYSNYLRCHNYSRKVAQALACKLCSSKCKNVNELRKHQEKEHAKSAQTVLLNHCQEPLPLILKMSANNLSKGKSPRKVVPKERTVSKRKLSGREKWAYCWECRLRLKVNSVRPHLVVRHIGKRCLQCEGCTFSTPWHGHIIKTHLERNHAGEKIGFVDKRHEIEDEIKGLIKQCITFHHKS